MHQEFGTNFASAMKGFDKLKRMTLILVLVQNINK